MLRAVGYMLATVAWLAAIGYAAYGVLSVEPAPIGWALSFAAAATGLGLATKAVDVLEQIRDRLNR
jgi:hypothetical protein